jgi:hypothetical protein
MVPKEMLLRGKPVRTLEVVLFATHRPEKS